ncbi:MAG: hypothetical protein JKY55_20020 [Aliivibrio sp.]|uniref:hypothetical protein n=1 Tax=Aliivibrio sp. TaxID=1872443 RepID=UPI001A39E81A|nr:hypothetical protein [Aliivibrio sp.]
MERIMPVRLVLFCILMVCVGGCAVSAPSLEIVDDLWPVVTQHSGAFNGRIVAYTAIVEKTEVLDSEGNPGAYLVTISYTAQEEGLERPVLFLFNGGPIVSSLYLHIGGFGLGWEGSTSFSNWRYSESVTEVLNKNPDFRVLVGAGYYDTQTTTGASEYLVSQSGWPEDRVFLRYYQGGHMAYSVEESARILSEDMRAFIKGDMQ